MGIAWANHINNKKGPKQVLTLSLKVFICRAGPRNVVVEADRFGKLARLRKESFERCERKVFQGNQSLYESRVSHAISNNVIVFQTAYQAQKSLNIGHTGLEKLFKVITASFSILEKIRYEAILKRATT